MTTSATFNQTDKLRTALNDWAEHVEALPPQYRVEIVSAALQFVPSGSFEQAYLVGFYRALAWRCLSADRRTMPVPEAQEIVDRHATEIIDRLSPLSKCADVPSVRMILGDLLGFVHQIGLTNVTRESVLGTDAVIDNTPTCQRDP